MSSPVLIPQSPCLSIHDFFQKSYVVPEFQRGYAWKAEHVKALLDDLREFLDSPSSVYLLGQVIVAYSNSDADYILIDGQQRITTLILILIVLHKRFLQIPNIHMNMSLNFKASRLGALIMRDSGNHRNELRANVTVSEDGIDLLEALIHNKELPVIKNWTQENLLDAFDTINEYFDEYWSDLGQIPSLYEKLVNRIYMVRLELPEIDTAVETFEKINNRGLGLSSSDLIKNVIFYRVQNDTLQDEIAAKWGNAAEILYGCQTSRIRNMEYLLRALIFKTTGDLVSARNMRTLWAQRLDTQQRAKQFALSLPHQAKYLKNIDLGKTPNGNDIQAFQGSRYFGTVQHFPILLAGAHLAADKFEFLAKIVEDRTVISLFSKERPQDYERIVPKWSYAIANLSQNATLEEIREASEPAFNDVKRILELVRVNMQMLRTRNSTGKKRIRYLLARISRKVMFDASIPAIPDLAAILKTSRITQGKSILGYDIEHIRPISTYSGEDITDSLGNLVLAHPNDNRSAGNEDPLSKVEVYRTSNLLLTQSLCRIEQLAINSAAKSVVNRIHEVSPPYLHEWNDESIQRRFELYWQIFLSDLAIPVK